LSELNYLDGLRPARIPEKEGVGARATESNPMAASLNPEEAEVLRVFAGGEILAPDGVAAQTGLLASQVSATLMMLELKRLVVKRADGRFEAR